MKLTDNEIEIFIRSGKSVKRRSWPKEKKLFDEVKAERLEREKVYSRSPLYIPRPFIFSEYGVPKLNLALSFDDLFASDCVTHTEKINHAHLNKRGQLIFLSEVDSKLKYLPHLNETIREEIR